MLSASFSPDGTKVVSGDDDQTVCILDRDGRGGGQTLQGHSSGVSSASFSRMAESRIRQRR